MLWSLQLLGCSDWFLRPNQSSDPAPLWEPVEETFVQGAVNQTDLLLVVDDTASMAQEQDALGGLLGPWLDALDALQVGWQIGVVTTNMEVEDAGWLRGTPYVLTPDTFDRDATFADMIAVGTLGLGAEAGLAAAITALDLAVDGPNAGFRRPDAALHVVFISDTDDQSDVWLRDGPVSAFLARLEEEAEAAGLPAMASAMVGPTPSGCSTATGSAQAGSRYIDISLVTGGAHVDICSPTLDPIDAILSALAQPARLEFPLSRIPVADSVEVEVEGASAADWALAGDAVVRFDAPPAPGSVIAVRYLAEVSSSEASATTEAYSAGGSTRSAPQEAR